MYPHITLKPKREASLVRGHPWLFSGAVASVEGAPESGEIVTAVSGDGKLLGLGFYNARTDIVFRLITKDASARIDNAFWKKRIDSAMSLRAAVIPPSTNAYRLVNAEGDRMPGLVVDRYENYLVFSLGTAGMERWRESLVEILVHALKPAAIFERSEGRARLLEGLENRVGLAAGQQIPETAQICENGLHFKIDILSGQKTGFFLDQRTNRQVIGSLCKEASVLNCFSYTGAFSAYCAQGGARRVVSIDTSSSANDLAKANLDLNGFTSAEHVVLTEDAFSYLRKTSEEFDIVIIDPPAFAKSKKDLQRAARGYKDINLQAIKRLKEGGLLATFSCSNHLDELLFQKIVSGAVRDAGATAQVLKVLGPGPDHPYDLAHTEGRYLKGFLLRLLTK